MLFLWTHCTPHSVDALYSPLCGHTVLPILWTHCTPFYMLFLWTHCTPHCHLLHTCKLVLSRRNCVLPLSFVLTSSAGRGPYFYTVLWIWPTVFDSCIPQKCNHPCLQLVLSFLHQLEAGGVMQGQQAGQHHAQQLAAQVSDALRVKQHTASKQASTPG